MNRRWETSTQYVHTVHDTYIRTRFTYSAYSAYSAWIQTAQYTPYTFTLCIDVTYTYTPLHTTVATSYPAYTSGTITVITSEFLPGLYV